MLLTKQCNKLDTDSLKGQLLAKQMVSWSGSWCAMYNHVIKQVLITVLCPFDVDAWYLMLKPEKFDVETIEPSCITEWKGSVSHHNKSLPITAQRQAVCRAGLRRGNRGNCPGPSAPRGPFVMTFICFKLNISLKNCRDSKEMHEYNSIFRCCVEYH